MADILSIQVPCKEHCYNAVEPFKPDSLNCRYSIIPCSKMWFADFLVL